MSSGSGSSSRRSPPRGLSPTPRRQAETSSDPNRAARDLLRETVRLLNCAGSSARTARLAFRSASYSLRPVPNLISASSRSIGSAANCIRASSKYLSTLAPLPNSPVPELFSTLHRSASWMYKGIHQLGAPMSPVAEAMQSTATLLSVAAASVEKAAVAGAKADSHHHRRDRTRSRSPRLETPSDGDATPNDSVGAHAAALDDAPRGGASGVKTPRAGASGDGTPQDATSNLNFSHILIKHKDSRRPLDREDKPVTRTKDQAMALVIDIHQQISRDLITFADAAVSFSDCTSARHEGDINYRFKRGRMQESFQSAALALGPGKISEIIETNSGYHIIQRAEAGAAGESRRHSCHRTRSRSPLVVAAPSDGDAASTDAKPCHSTRRDAVARDGSGRDGSGRDGAGRDAVARDGAGRDAVARDGAGRDAVARDGAGRDAVARDGAGRDAVARDGVGRDGAGADAVAQDTAERDATPCDGASGDGASRDRASGEGASGEGASGNGTPNDAAPQDANLKFNHILIKHKDSRDPVDIEDKPVTRTKKQALSLAIDIHKKISAHQITFADAAVSFSECVSAPREGVIKTQFKSRRVQKNFEAVVRTLEPGHISRIIDTNYGYHILQRRE